MTVVDFFDQVEKSNPHKVVVYFENEKWTTTQANFLNMN